MGFPLFGRKAPKRLNGQDAGRFPSGGSAVVQRIPTNPAEDVVTGRSIPPTAEFVGTAEAILERFRERAG